MESTINIRGVLAEMNKATNPFTIEFRRKGDGQVSKKENVVKLNTTGKELTDRRTMSRSGLVKLFQIDGQQDFEIVIDFIRKFNGKTVVY